ncbi:cupredoxin domain-containing protein [Rhodococcus sp. SGAir0479]|uniref:cupredoxin domain-containing protein n=1 Tax=Rhodococcus sp. SGAir0479 TaxID=2567884 RepID=UPI0010CD4466|nr:cupredoxin domain-containing protein [Rhodococcus sp. SGAir0479]QCQ92141.1 copper-binding protein [Rhodococcus sp. SGAir0479]
MNKRASALIAGIALAASLSGCTSASTDDATQDADKALTVRVANMAYTPASLTVSAGQTVTWEFDDRGTPHDVVGLGDAKGVLRSPLLTSGTWEFTFTQPGTYNYTCSLHPDMLGVVVVV